RIPTRCVRSLALLATNRQGELKRRASVVICGCPQSPAVSFDNRPADCQSHAHALRLGRVEGIEETVEGLRIQARAGISHGDQYRLRVIGAGANQQLSWAIAGAVHGFYRVVDQVENDLL